MRAAATAHLTAGGALRALRWGRRRSTHSAEWHALDEDHGVCRDERVVFHVLCGAGTTVIQRGGRVELGLRALPGDGVGEREAHGASVAVELAADDCVPKRRGEHRGPLELERRVGGLRLELVLDLRHAAGLQRLPVERLGVATGRERDKGEVWLPVERHYGVATGRRVRCGYQ